MLIRIAATTNIKIEVAKVKRIAFQKKSLPTLIKYQILPRKFPNLENAPVPFFFLVFAVSIYILLLSMK